MRRNATEETTTFRLGDWLIHPRLNRIERAGQVVNVQHLSMQVLIFLAERQGTVATYDELLDSLWSGRVVGEDAVHRRIADLRRRLEDDARAPTYIETIPKRGYRLISPIREIDPVLRRSSSLWGTLAVVAFIALLVGIGFSIHQ